MVGVYHTPPWCSCLILGVFHCVALLLTTLDVKSPKFNKIFKLFRIFYKTLIIIKYGGILLVRKDRWWNNDLWLVEMSNMEPYPCNLIDANRFWTEILCYWDVGRWKCYQSMDPKCKTSGSMDTRSYSTTKYCLSYTWQSNWQHYNLPPQKATKSEIFPQYTFFL